MERHLRSRPARGRLAVVALVCGVAGCVPLAPFERPAPSAGAPGSEPVAQGPATPPDLPERGDNPAQPSAQPSVEPAEAGAPQAAAIERPTDSAPAAAPDPVQAEVRGLLEGFYAAYNAREWKRARAQFWDGATITDVRMLPDQPTPAVKVSSVAEFFDELARARESGPQGFEGRLEGAPEVRTGSNVAQAWCHFQASFGGPQESMSWRRIDAFTFVLHEGTWKIASLAQSSSFDVPVER